MITLMDMLLAIAMIGLLMWVLQLKARIKQLEYEQSTRPPEAPPLSAQDLRKVQQAMVSLVQDVECYTENQLTKMKQQNQSIQSLADHLEAKLKEMEEPPPPPSDSTVTRVVPLSTPQGQGNHQNRDKIIQLYKEGWPAEKIAEELRITRGEVQLIVNLI